MHIYGEETVFLTVRMLLTYANLGQHASHAKSLVLLYVCVHLYQCIITMKTTTLLLFLLPIRFLCPAAGSATATEHPSTPTVSVVLLLLSLQQQQQQQQRW